MIAYSWGSNLVSGILLAAIALTATIEARSSSLIPKSLLLWPALLIAFGLFTMGQGILSGASLTAVFGIVLILCGIQAAMVNIRRLTPWPSGAVWLALVLAGIGFQFYPYFEQRLMGFLWMAVGATKVMRERSAALDAGIPVWIQLLYLGAVLLAAYH